MRDSRTLPRPTGGGRRGCDLRESRHSDFTGYRRTSLRRRVLRRMEQVGIGDFGDYLDRLPVDPDDSTALFTTILINVTALFRDAGTWELPGDHVLPGLLAARTDEQAVRVWCAGCASGEEAYTIAMLPAEHLGEEAFRRG